jgi:hypothetical protein
MHDDGKIQQNPGLLDIKGHFRQGSNEHGPMKLNKSFKLVSRLLDEGS